MAMLRSESSKNKLGLHASPLLDNLGPGIYFVDGPRLLELIQRHEPLGALDGGGGGPMSPINFRKWHVPVAIFCDIPVNSKMVQCRLSILRNGYVPCRYF